MASIMIAIAVLFAAVIQVLAAQWHTSYGSGRFFPHAHPIAGYHHPSPAHFAEHQSLPYQHLLAPNAVPFHAYPVAFQHPMLPNPEHPANEPDHPLEHQEDFLSCRVEMNNDRLTVNVMKRKYHPWLTSLGLKEEAAGLDVTIEVLSEDGGDVVIAFTERALTVDPSTLTEDCSAVGMGSFTHPLIYSHDPDHRMEYPGEIVTHRLVAGQKYSTTVEDVAGYRSLGELAGRGVVVCPSDMVEEDDHGHFSCGVKNTRTAAGSPCCGLVYTNLERFMDED